MKTPKTAQAQHTDDWGPVRPPARTIRAALVRLLARELHTTPDVVEVLLASTLPVDGSPATTSAVLGLPVLDAAAAYRRFYGPIVELRLRDDRALAPGKRARRGAVKGACFADADTLGAGIPGGRRR